MGCEKGKRNETKRHAPLIHDGIDPPVRNPMQSFVKELQLKSTGIHERAAAMHLHTWSFTLEMILGMRGDEER